MTERLKEQFHGFAHVQALALAVVNFTVSYNLDPRALLLTEGEKSSGEP